MKLTESHDLAFNFAHLLKAERLSTTDASDAVWDLTATMPPVYISEAFKIIGIGNALKIAQMAEATYIPERDHRWLCIGLLGTLLKADLGEISSYVESLSPAKRNSLTHLASVSVCNRMRSLLTQTPFNDEAVKTLENQLPNAFFLPKMEEYRDLIGILPPSQHLIVGAKVIGGVIRVMETLPNMGMSMSEGGQEKLAVYASIAQSQLALDLGIYEPLHTLGEMKDLVEETIKSWNYKFENTALGADDALKVSAVTTLESLIHLPVWEQPILKEGPAKKAMELHQVHNAVNLHRVLFTEQRLKAGNNPAITPA